MGFDTLPFLLFFVFIWAVSRLRASRGGVLLAASLAFYAFSGVADTLLFFIVVTGNYFLGRCVKVGNRVLAMSVGLNLLVLVWFKYRGLLFEGVMAGSFVGEVAIPLGISFYIFQSIAYLVDVHRGVVAHEKALHRFCLFVAFFPQLIAGPIVRAHTLLPQLQRLFAGKGRNVHVQGVGLALCALGVVKKVVFADSIAPFVDEIFLIGPADSATAWLGVVLFAFQIYFDFSGYSDMAVGMAWLFGIRLPFNFRTPYLACSPQDFWRRWHITLSDWIRDYLYIPLGGSRVKSPVLRLGVLIVVMGLAGLWHGANGTFLCWGLLWGLAIAVFRTPVVSRMTRGSRLAGWFATMLLVVSLWVVFRSPDITFARDYSMLMWGVGKPLGTIGFFPDVEITAFMICGCASLLGLHAIEQHACRPGVIKRVRDLDGPLLRGALLAIIVWFLVLPKMSANPFIYFRF